MALQKIVNGAFVLPYALSEYLQKSPVSATISVVPSSSVLITSVSTKSRSTLVSDKGNNVYNSWPAIHEASMLRCHPGRCCCTIPSDNNSQVKNGKQPLICERYRTEIRVDLLINGSNVNDSNVKLMFNLLYTSLRPAAPSPQAYFTREQIHTDT